MNFKKTHVYTINIVKMFFFWKLNQTKLFTF